MIWHWPQWVMAGLIFFNLAASFGLHGQPKTGKFNAGVALAGAAASIALLYYGGFWGIQP